MYYALSLAWLLELIHPLPQPEPEPGCCAPKVKPKIKPALRPEVTTLNPVSDTRRVCPNAG